MEQFGQAIVYGIAGGSIYVLIALGFTLVYGVLHRINFAHGQMYMLGATLTYVLTERAGLPYVASLLIATVGVGVVGGVVVERVAFRPLRNAPEIGTFVSTLALAIMIPYAWARYYGTESKLVETPFAQSLDLGVATISLHRLVIIVVGIVLVVGLQLLLQRTDMGRVIRAAAQDSTTLSLLGVNVDRAVVFTFVLGSGMAALAGGLVSPLVGNEPFMGTEALLKAFVVVVVGGFGSVAGTVVAGLGLGVMEVIVGTYWSTDWVSTIGFIILVLMLLVRPQGLLGRPEARYV